MSGDAGIKVVGLGELVRALKQAGQSVDDLKDANQEASRIVLREAQRGTPHRTGALEASGRINRAAKKASVLFGNARVKYAGVIHYGWPAHHIKANPWVTDAAEHTRPEWSAVYEHEIQKVLDNVKGK